MNIGSRFTNRVLQFVSKFVMRAKDVEVITVDAMSDEFLNSPRIEQFEGAKKLFLEGNLAETNCLFSIVTLQKEQRAKDTRSILFFD